MRGRCLLCKLCALFLLRVEAVVQCQMINQHDAPMPAGSHQQNAFYALRSCHQIFHGDSGEFFSPDYLCSNPALWCNWTIQVQPGRRVQVYLMDLTPEHVCHLKTDQIHLDESPVSAGESHILERCWRSSIYTSVSNTVHVVQLIHSNPSPPHRGIYGVYQAFGLPETPNLNEDLSEEEQVKTEEAEAKDVATKIPGQKSFSNELEEDVVAHVEHMGVSHSINPQINDALAATAGTFRESRKIRGEAKHRKVPVHGALPQADPEDVEELVSAPTEIPNWMTLEKYAPVLFDDGPHGAHTLAPTYTTRSFSTSTGTTPTQSTKKRSPKRKPVLTQPSTATSTTDEPAKATPLVENFAGVSMEILKADGATLLQAASEEHVGDLLEKNPNLKKIKQSQGLEGQSLPVQTFRLVTEAPHVLGDCSRTSVPTLLYAVCFLLCFLIALLVLALGVMHRRYHHGKFLPRCRRSGSNFTDNDINNNPNSGSGGDGRTSRPPPPPPPLLVAGGAQDLRLLRFSPLTPPDGFEGKPQEDND